jgi:nanoRNase/pAp phosphatase (c-di-AMP/oligoRNAs hydrolase)
LYLEFNNYLSTLKNESLIYIFLHHNADPDALCSAEAIKNFIHTQYPEIQVLLFADSLNISSKRIAKALNIEVKLEIPNIKPDSIITVDTANFSQLNKFENFIKQTGMDTIVIDHHSKSELAETANLKIHDTQMGSTCLIVANLFKIFNLKPSPRISTLLICGHLYDSRRFIHGSTPITFRLIADLIEYGGNYSEAHEYLQNAMSLGEKIARIKASKRINYRVVKDLIIAATKVSAFESSAARSLIALGCNVIFVIGKKEDETRGSARSGLLNDLNMGEILAELISEFENETKELETKFECSSGGHKNAAGMNIKPSLSNKQQQKLMQRFLEMVEVKLHSSN